MADPVCVRCDGPLVPPNGSDRWTCVHHGAVEPLHPAVPAEPHHLADTASSSGVPVWLPWPPPRDWVVAGVRRTAGTGMARGVVVALSGPGRRPRARPSSWSSPRSRAWASVRRTPASTRPTPAPSSPRCRADTKVTADGHSIPLWSLPVLTGDRAVYVGEAAGCWLWAIVWPVTEWMVVHDDLRLVDLRAPEQRPHAADVRTGALTPRLTR